MWYRVVKRKRNGRYVVQRSIGGRVWIDDGEFYDESLALARMNALAEGRMRARDYPRRRRRRAAGRSCPFRIAMITSSSRSSISTRK